MQVVLCSHVSNSKFFTLVTGDPPGDPPKEDELVGLFIRKPLRTQELCNFSLGVTWSFLPCSVGIQPYPEKVISAYNAVQASDPRFTVARGASAPCTVAPHCWHRSLIVHSSCIPSWTWLLGST